MQQKNVHVHESGKDTVFSSIVDVYFYLTVGYMKERLFYLQYFHSKSERENLKGTQ